MRAEAEAPAAKPQRKPWRRPTRRGKATQGDGLEAIQPGSWGAVRRLARAKRAPRASISPQGRAGGSGASEGVQGGILVKGGKWGEMESGKSRRGEGANLRNLG